MPLSLVDLTKRLAPGDNAALAVAEILNRNSPLLMDSIWMPTNKTDTRTGSVRAKLPESERRTINEPVGIGQSTVTQIEEATTSREIYSENDVMLIDSFGEGAAAARATEAQAFIEGMAQDFSEDLYYGNRAIDPKGINGLAQRYNTLTGNISQNVISAGGTQADNSSIYLVAWDEGKVSCIYPKAATGMSKGAVEHEDMNTDVAQYGDTNNAKRLKVYRDRFAISGGWFINDWRCVVRIANIDISTLAGTGMGGAEHGSSRLRFLMTRALHRLPMMSGKLRFYMNRTVAEYLDIERLKAVSSAGLTYKEVDGMEVPTFRNIPIRIDDNLLTTEAAVA